MNELDELTNEERETTNKINVIALEEIMNNLLKL